MAATQRGPWHAQTIANGRYQSLTTIGDGGMGFVYRALDSNLRTQVVIKAPRTGVLPKDSDIAQFEQEIRALVRLSFPHIVPVIDAGAHQGAPFAVMRFLSGGSLADRLRKPDLNRQDPAFLAGIGRWLGSIAKSLDFVHQQNYVHHDVKPANILFDSHGQAYLSDFGVSKVLGKKEVSGSGQRPAQSAFLLGTPCYMAPELFDGGACDGRADQYALAITVYEFLAGQPPFQAQNHGEWIAAHRTQPPEPLANIAPHVPAGVSHAVAKALAKAPQDRFKSCSDFALAVLRGSSQKSHVDPTPVAIPGVSRGGPAKPAGNDNASRPAQTISQDTTRIATEPAKTTSAAKRRGSRHQAWPVAILVAILVTVGAITGGAAWLLSLSSEPLATSPSSLPRAAELGRRIEDWSRRLNVEEKLILIDSPKVLAHPSYASEQELLRLIEKLSKDPRELLAKSYPKLEADLIALERDRAARQADLEDQRRRSPDAATSSEAMKIELRELLEKKTQLQSLVARLDQLRQSLKSGKPLYDEPLAKELSALRDLEVVLAARRRVAAHEETLRRACEWMNVGLPALQASALNALARSDDPLRNRLAIDRLGARPADQQAALARSLLLSGDPAAIAAATDCLRQDPRLVAQCDLADLCSLADETPALYEPLLAALAAGCTSSDDRFRVFRSQAATSADWPPNVEEACEHGLLGDRVEAVITEILVNRRTQGFALAERLLGRRPRLSLNSLAADQLSGWFSASPALANRVAERFLLYGTAGQRRAVVAQQQQLNFAVDKKFLQNAISQGFVTDPTTLLNLLLATSDPLFLALAETMLGRRAEAPPADVKFRDVSAAALAREPIRQPLLDLAWRGAGPEHAWALRQTLGREFLDQFAGLELHCSRAWQALEAVIPTLDGKKVALPGGTGDLGLPMKTLDLADLRDDFASAEWGDKEQARVGVASLRQRMSEVERLATSLAQADLKRIASFLDDSDSLFQLTFELTRVHEMVIGKQLAGAKRELRKKGADSWTFRLMKPDHETWNRERPQYEGLRKRWENDRKALPAITTP